MNVVPLPAAPQTLPDDETRTRRVPPYNVILENDNHHSQEFVVEVLCKALGFAVSRTNDPGVVGVRLALGDSRSS